MKIVLHHTWLLAPPQRSGPDPSHYQRFEDSLISVQETNVTEARPAELKLQKTEAPWREVGAD